MLNGLQVFGTIDLDTLSGPFGYATDELGGSALYFALAASLIRPVSVVAAVGEDTWEVVQRTVMNRPIDVSGISVLSRPTSRWHAQQLAGHNVEVERVDSILDVWQPKVPINFEGWAFLASMPPRLQVSIAHRLGGAQLRALDTMVSYLREDRQVALAALACCNWLFCNEEEFDELNTAAMSPSQARLEWQLGGLCLKRGRHGAEVYTSSDRLAVPALATHPVVDATGAGDALAGGMLAAWLNAHGDRTSLKESLLYGIACASVACEGVGLAGLCSATPDLLARRLKEVRHLVES